jgi:hypothetical protein
MRCGRGEALFHRDGGLIDLSKKKYTVPIGIALVADGGEAA